MRAIKLGKWEISEEELERQYAEAIKRGRESERNEPRAQNAYYDKKAKRIIVELTNGSTLSIPPSLIQGLKDAPEKKLSPIEISPSGTGLRWEALDVDMGVAGLANDIFGTRAWMAALGRKGGRVSTKAKAAAAVMNGKKGGRPRKSRSEKPAVRRGGG